MRGANTDTNQFPLAIRLDFKLEKEGERRGGELKEVRGGEGNPRWEV